MCSYAAITIGPIIDTLSLAVSPGTLWCASTMFSHLAGELCGSILEKLPEAKILVPDYAKNAIKADGIGRFHDRIFFTCELEREPLAEQLKTLCENAKTVLAGHISGALGEFDEKERQKTERYISGYIQLNWLIADKDTAEKDGKNCILNLSQYLDCMELNARRLPEETNSPIVRLLNGTEEGSNVYINNCWLIPDRPDNFQLMKGDKVRSIKDIANPFNASDGRKIHSYFAVVQSDGDNMGAMLSACPPEQVHAFSQCCIKYAESAAEKIGAYGGLTIYAGGDDLLFLAPLEGKDGKNLLSLCADISDAFHQGFQQLADNMAGARTPTLSFGISVNYQKAPLYEALEDARGLLFGQAKSGKKNQLALSTHKHSGQSVFLLLPNNSTAGSPIAGLCALISGSRADSADNALHSVVYQLETFRSLFTASLKDGFDAQNLYDNLFDSAAHDMGRAYINRIKALADTITAFPTCRADDGKTSVTGEAVDVLTSMLRFIKLFTERGTEE